MYVIFQLSIKTEDAESYEPPAKKPSLKLKISLPKLHTLKQMLMRSKSKSKKNLEIPAAVKMEPEPKRVVPISKNENIFERLVFGSPFKCGMDEDKPQLPIATASIKVGIACNTFHSSLS